MPARFGRRRAPGAPLRLTAEHVRCGVAALHGLPRDARLDPAVRARRLVHALRRLADGAPVDAMIASISMRIHAFERMLEARPQLLGGRKASADLEHAVYVAIATEPLLVIGADGRRFDAASFVRRVDDVLAMLARRGLAASPDASGEAPPVFAATR